MEEVKQAHSILLVDDDRLLRDMYAVKFKEQGFTTEEAEGALEALERLRAGLSPDVIMFDIVMPGLDGYGFLETLHTEGLVPRAIKVALSNQGLDAEIERAKSLGANEFIVKANTIPSQVVSQVVHVVQNNSTI